MNTATRQTLKPATESYPVSAPRPAHAPCTTRAIGIGDILGLKVGCWQPPVLVGRSLPIGS
jgi:hypothetical protein